MIFFTFFLNLLSIFLFKRNFHFFSPIIIFCLFNNTLLIYYFFIIYDFPIVSNLQNGTALPLFMAGHNIGSTVNLYLIFSILCFFCTQIKIINFKKKENLNYNLIDGNNLFIKSLSFLFIILIIFHAIDLDWSVYWSYYEYLQVRDHSFAGRDISVTIIFDTSKRLIGLLSIFFFFILKKKDFIYKYSFLIVFFYILFLSFIEVSRFFPLLIMSIPISYLLVHNKISKLLFILFLFITILAYFIVLEFRSSNQFGISVSVDQIKSIYKINFFSNLIKVFGNLFQGAVIYDISQNIETYYPLKHKILSFLPTLTVIDGWDVNWVNDNRITKFNPINSFGEAYKFGLIYLLIYQVIFVTLMYLGSANFSLNLQNNKILYVAAILNYFIIFFSSQYSLRPTMRLIIINFFLIIIIDYFSKKNNFLRKL